MRGAARAAEVVPAEKRLAGAGAYSERLADLDTRLDHLYVQRGEDGERLGYICERLDRIEKSTGETNGAITTLMDSIRRHPLIGKFLGGK